jgi:flavin reductase (DIM6/NTAB) family NADH-FMN oxidoreductase RutF
MPIDQNELRKAMRRWASGVTVVTASYNNKKHGMTVSSFTSVSVKPPLVTISLMKDSRTLDMLTSSNSFAITILSTDQVEISKIFAGQIGDDNERFDGIETYELVTGAPLIAAGLAFFDCKVFDKFDFSSNSLIIGEVLEVKINPAGQPLLYFDQHYSKLQE